MKFTCDRSALVDKLGVLARASPRAALFPCFRASSSRRERVVSTSSPPTWKLSIKANLSTPVEREGDIVVPARLFSDVVRNLPDEEVVIEAGEAAVKVSAGRAAFRSTPGRRRTSPRLPRST